MAPNPKSWNPIFFQVLYVAVALIPLSNTTIVPANHPTQATLDRAHLKPFGLHRSFIPLDSIHANELDADDFMRKYVARRRPVLIRGAAVV